MFRRERERGCNAVTQVEGDYNKGGIAYFIGLICVRRKGRIERFSEGSKTKKKKERSEEKGLQDPEILFF